MKQLGYLILAAGLLLFGCSKKESAPAAQSTNAAAASGNPLTAPVDYLGAVGKAHKSAVKIVDLTSLSQMVQLFNASEGRFPKDLNELVTQKYLPSLPAPPYGMTFDYNPATGQVKVVPK